jgi:hypothetical protein
MREKVESGRKLIIQKFALSIHSNKNSKLISCMYDTERKSHVNALYLTRKETVAEMPF